jgi:hypothetical protein
MADLHRGRHSEDVISDSDEALLLLHDILIQLKLINLHLEEWDGIRASEKDFENKDEV